MRDPGREEGNPGSSDKPAGRKGKGWEHEGKGKGGSKEGRIREGAKKGRE